MPDRATTSRLITAAAREHLQPIGLRRRGRSRSWFDDRGWWLIHVEFQPSLNNGTYLNVGAMWLWANSDHWSFDDGYRIWWREDGTFTTQPPAGERGWTSFLTYVADTQFAADINLLADIARSRVEQLRATYPDPQTAAHRLASQSARPAEPGWWRDYHTAAAAALSGDTTTARHALARIHAGELDPDWVHDLAQQARDLEDLADQPAMLQTAHHRPDHRDATPPQAPARGGATRVAARPTDIAGDAEIAPQPMEHPAPTD